MGHKVALFKGLVLLIQGVLLWTLLAVLTGVSGAGFDGLVIAEAVEAVPVVDLGHLYSGIEYGALAMAVGGPVFYWVIYPMLMLLKDFLQPEPRKQVSFE